MHAAPAYVQQPLALPRGCPAGLQVFALRLLPTAIATPLQAQRQVLRSAVDHTVQATLGPGAGPLLHRPGQAPHWPHQSTWHGAIAYAWPLAVWGMCTGPAWGVDVEAIPAINDAQHYADVGALYWGPTAQACIANGAEFAAHWCALEAQLKCAGLPLAEATSRPQGWNAELHTAALALPEAWGSYCAVLAWRA